MSDIEDFNKKEEDKSSIKHIEDEINQIEEEEKNKSTNLIGQKRSNDLTMMTNENNHTASFKRVKNSQPEKIIPKGKSSKKSLEAKKEKNLKQKIEEKRKGNHSKNAKENHEPSFQDIAKEIEQNSRNAGESSDLGRFLCNIPLNEDSPHQEEQSQGENRKGNGNIVLSIGANRLLDEKKSENKSEFLDKRDSEIPNNIIKGLEIFSVIEVLKDFGLFKPQYEGFLLRPNII